MCQLLNPSSCHPPFLTYSPFPCLTQSTTTLKTSIVSWVVIDGQWCVARLLFLSHMHTPPVDSFTFMWEFLHSFPSSCRDSRFLLLMHRFGIFFTHAESWESVFWHSRFYCVCAIHILGCCGFSFTIGGSWTFYTYM